MAKKRNDGDLDLSGAETFTVVSEPTTYAHQEPIVEEEPAAPPPPPPRKSILPTLSIGDILALLSLIVLSAALLLEGFHKEFKDYSKEIVALFAIVVGFLLGRKT